METHKKVLPGIYNYKGAVYSILSLKSAYLDKHNGDVYHVIEINQDFIYADGEWIRITSGN